MNLILLFHLIFLCALNISFFFSGVVLNTLLIITILKSTQLRKKFCHLMITCCRVVFLQFLKNNELYATLTIYWDLLFLPAGLCACILMVMCSERYLGAYYPLFHKTSVTRLILLTLLIILIILTSS